MIGPALPMQRSLASLPRVVVGLTASLLAGLAMTASAADDEAKQPPAGFEWLFDGKTLDGWEGPKEIFRVEQGAIVGGSLDKPVARNEFLCTTRRFGDFELRLKFKLLGEGANAGVQIRSERVPDNHEMIGYQADLGEGWWGCLYDESRRNTILGGPPQQQRSKPVKLNDWNDYTIRCQGRRIQLWINGTQTLDYTEQDESLPQTGLIGLQIHGGPPSEAWYKDIAIRELPAP